MAFQIVLHQMIVFFLVLAIGFVAGKLGIIEKDYLPKFAKLITSILLPVMIFTLTRNGSTRQMVFENWGIIVFAIVFYAAITAIMYGIAKLLRLRPDRDRVFTLCFVFGNTGFIGTPLLAALYPEGGLMYMGLFGIIDIAYFWTGGLFWRQHVISTTRCHPKTSSPQTSSQWCLRSSSSCSSFPFPASSTTHS